jgi:hypothetical protein
MPRRKKQNVEFVKSFTPENKKKSIPLSKNKELCENLTKSACLRPDIFLKNRDCDECYLKEYCIAPIKVFSWEKNKRKRNYEN